MITLPDGTNLADAHQQLISQESHSADASRTLERMEQELADISARAEQLKEQVDCYRQRKAKERAVLFKTAHALAITEKYRKNQAKEQEYVTNQLMILAKKSEEELMGNITRKVKMAKRELENFKNQLAGTELESPAMQKDLASMQREFNAMIGYLDDKIQAEKSKLQRAKNKFNKELIDLNKLNDDIIGYTREQEQKQREYDENKDSWQAELEAIETRVNEVKERRDTAEDEMKLVDSRVAKVRETIHVDQKELDKAKDTKQKRLRGVRQFLTDMKADRDFNSVVKGSQLIAQYESNFEKPIIVPILDIVVSNTDAANVLVQQCRPSDLCNFVAQTPTDNSTLHQLARENGIALNITFFDNPDELSLDYWQRQKIAAQCYGFDSVLIDELSGSDAAVCFLAKYCQVHQVPFMNKPPPNRESFKNKLIEDGWHSLTYFILGREMTCKKLKKMEYSDDLDVAEISNAMKRHDASILNVFQDSRQDSAREKLEEKIRTNHDHMAKLKIALTKKQSVYAELTEKYNELYRSRQPIKR